MKILLVIAVLVFAGCEYDDSETTYNGPRVDADDGATVQVNDNSSDGNDQTQIGDDSDSNLDQEDVDYNITNTTEKARSWK